METWIVIGIIVLSLVIIGLVLFFLLKKSSLTLHTLLKNGLLFPYNTVLTITNTSSTSFTSFMCIDTQGNLYSLNESFEPQQSLQLDMTDTNSLLCIGQSNTTQYITVIGNVASDLRLFHINTDASTLSFSATDLSATLIPQKYVYSTQYTIQHPLNDSPLLNDTSFPASFLITNCASHSVIMNGFSYNTLYTMQLDLSIFSNITDVNKVMPNDLRLDPGVSSLPIMISLPSDGYIIFIGTIITMDSIPYRTGFVLLNQNNKLKIVPIGNPVLELSLYTKS